MFRMINAYTSTLFPHAVGRVVAHDNDPAVTLAGSTSGPSLGAAAYKLVSAVYNFITSTFDRFRKSRKRRATIRELSRLSDWLLADIGVHRSDIPSVVDDLLATNEAQSARAAGRVERTAAQTSGTRMTANSIKPGIAA